MKFLVLSLHGHFGHCILKGCISIVRSLCFRVQCFCRLPTVQSCSPQNGHVFRANCARSTASRASSSVIPGHSVSSLFPDVRPGSCAFCVSVRGIGAVASRAWALPSLFSASSLGCSSPRSVEGTPMASSFAITAVSGLVGLSRQRSVCTAISRTGYGTPQYLHSSTTVVATSSKQRCLVNAVEGIVLPHVVQRMCNFSLGCHPCPRVRCAFSAKRELKVTRQLLHARCLICRDVTSTRLVSFSSCVGRLSTRLFTTLLSRLPCGTCLRAQGVIVRGTFMFDILS